MVLWSVAPWAPALAGPLCLVYAALWVPILRHRSRLDAKTGLLNLPTCARAWSASSRNRAPPRRRSPS